STCVVVPPNAMPRESSSGPSVCRSSLGCIWIRCARCVCGSTPPGTTILPAASITRLASSNVPGAATATILPSCTAISHAPAPCGVTTWPSQISRSSIARLLWRPTECRAARVSGRQQTFESPRQRRSGPAVLVLEEHERVAPAGAGRADRVDPGRKPRVCVVHGAQPEVAPIRGGDHRCRRVLVLDDGQGRVACAQTLVHVVREPGPVAKLPGHPE